MTLIEQLESFNNGDSITIMGNNGIIYNGKVCRGNYRTKSGEYFYVDTVHGSFAKGEIYKVITSNN